MLKDRGKKKWQGFFVPEHIQQLKQAMEEDKKIPRPQLDEGQIEEIERLLKESLEMHTLLEITTWKNGFYTSRVGTVTKIDSYHKKVFLQDELESTIPIGFYDITNVISR